MNRNKATGFSLVELLVVVSIIAVVAAIAVPNLLASRKAANEAGVISNLRTLSTANVTYQALYGNNSTYAVNLSALGNAGLVDARWAGSPVLSGYTYFYFTGNTNRGFCLTAGYGSNDSSGTNSYAISHQGTIYKIADSIAPSCDSVTGLIVTGAPL